MNNHPIAFLFCGNNDIYHSVQNTCLLSHTLLSPREDKRCDLKGNGVFMYPEKLEHPIALFCARSLVKSH